MSDLTSARLGVVVAVFLTAMAAASLDAMDHDAPGGTDQLPQAEPTSLCSAYPNKSAEPVDAVLGEPVTVTTHVKALCRGVQHYDHIALVLDGSETMTNQASREMKSAAQYLVRQLQLDSRSSTRIGVVEFGATTRVLCRPTGDEQSVLNCINRVNRRGDPEMAAGIQEGTKMLRAARDPDPEFIAEVMIVMSNGQVDDCGPAVSARRQAQSAGILVASLCASRDCNSGCMRQVASSPRYHFESGEVAELADVLVRILGRHYSIRPRWLKVLDTLSSNVYYEPGSAAPTPSTPVAGSHIGWEVSYLPVDGVTFTHRIVPIATGEIPTSKEASGSMLDSMGRTVEFNFEIPIITVREPTATATASPTATPTPSPTTTLTATATPASRPAFIPRAVRFE